jgi:hypothetical protein
MALLKRKSHEPSLWWMRALHDSQDEQLCEAFLQCCLDVQHDFAQSALKLGITDDDGERMEQLLTLRGLLGYGVLMHCLAMRHRVVYGISTQCAPLSVSCPLSLVCSVP